MTLLYSKNYIWHVAHWTQHFGGIFNSSPLNDLANANRERQGLSTLVTVIELGTIAQQAARVVSLDTSSLRKRRVRGEKVSTVLQLLGGNPFILLLSLWSFVSDAAH